MDALAGSAGDDCAADHHGSDANDHHAAMRGRVDWYDVADILTVHIECRANRHRVDCVVLALDEFGLTQDAIDWNVEAVVILGCEAHDAKRTAVVAFGVLRVGVTKKTLHTELTTLDPDALGFVETVEDDGTTVSRADNDVWIVGCRAGTRVGLQLAVEELVKALEFVRGNEDLVHVELMEVDESLDLRGGRWVVVLSALLKGHGSEKFANCVDKLVIFFSVLMVTSSAKLEFHHMARRQNLLLSFSMRLLFRPLYSRRIPSRT